MRGIGRRLVVAAAGGPLLLAGSCVLLPRYPAVDPRPEPYPVERLAEELDPWLLADGFAEGLAVEIDWVEGCKPGPRTVAGLETILRKYVPAGRRIDVLVDDEIPRATWDEAVKEGHGTDALVERFAGIELPAKGGVEWRYALFVPGAGSFYGYTTVWTIERDARVVPLEGVVVARAGHARYAKLWIDRDRMERMTLVHEFGHVLGLVTNDRHERSHPDHQSHCNGLKCLMSHPTWRVILRNAPAGLFNVFPKDYCKRCQEDIRRAQQHWREQVAADPGYRASRERQRAARHARVALGPLYEDERYEELLARTRALREEFPNSDLWDGVEADALVGLGRVEEALVILERSLPADAGTRNYWSARWKAGGLMVAVGRHHDAAALFDRKALRRADPYDVEQSTFVLEDALTGAGRYAEAAEVVGDLLDRGHDISFFREGMRALHAALLRRAGNLAEAEKAVEAALRRKKTRRSCLDEAVALRRAQGRDAEADALLRELVAAVEKQRAEAKDPRARWWTGWHLVRLLAEAGEKDRARTLAAEIEAAVEPERTGARDRVWTQAPAWIALGELDRAAALVRALTVAERQWEADPCGMESLEPLRASPDHAALFAHCPERP